MPTKAVTDERQRAVDIHSQQAGLFADRYDGRSANPYSDCFVYSRHRLNAYLSRYLPLRGDGCSLLDVGCGTGHWMRALADRGFIVSGVDASDAMLEHARELNPDATIEQGDVDRLPFPDGTFDYVICIEVLRYLRDPTSAIREIARVLKPGGAAFVTAAPRLNLNGYWLVNQVTRRVPVGNLTQLRQYFTTSGTLVRQFRSAGLADVIVHGVYMGPLNWIERLAKSHLDPFLRWWEPVDRALSDRPVLRDVANMYLARAVRPAK
jgi:2-polyprenyl-3-methyl-5-hydroxy-6-metoxy-1,4-benzoquinol methylase